jgi:hypothetical protein
MIMMKHVVRCVLFAVVLLGPIGVSAVPHKKLPAHRVARPAVTAATGTVTQKTSPVIALPTTTPATPVSVIDLVSQPATYLNKPVSFQATFNSFAGLGLDYKPAFRDSKDYVSLIVLRPDVSWRIPLSELKLFYPRKKSDAVLHLDAGDTIKVTGTVFSTALGEPWLDIQDLTIEAKAKKADPKLTNAQGHTPTGK